MGTISISLPADGSTADVADYNTPITTIKNELNGSLNDANISGLSGTKITAGTLPGSALDTTTAGGYIAGLAAPNTVTCNGNRSYTLVFNSVDYTGTLSAGMRLRTTRTVAAPTQCTSLNGTTQYYSKTSPAGMTFTDDFTCGTSAKPSSYAQGTIESRYNGTSGWELRMESTGQISLYGYNAGSSNFKVVQTYQSIPLNKWSHIAAELDMSAITTNGTGLSSTTNYIMIDGVDVPCTTFTSGTGPTALIQAGNFEIGSRNGGLNPFPGKLAQTWFAPGKVTQANVRTIISQGLTASLISSLSLGSAYSFDNSINDLNTTNANNLTANGSAVATNADSPFGTQASGLISSTIDYGIIQSVTFSTNTTVVVQVPEGCTIPTSGGVSAVVYSSVKAPYGFPVEPTKYELLYINGTSQSTTSATYVNFSGASISAPIGAWKPVGVASIQHTTQDCNVALSTSSTAASDPTLVVRDFPTASATHLTKYHIEASADTFNFSVVTLLYFVGKATSGTLTLRGMDDIPSYIKLMNALL
jgi:hypothetical protein